MTIKTTRGKSARLLIFVVRNIYIPPVSIHFNNGGVMFAITITCTAVTAACFVS